MPGKKRKNRKAFQARQVIAFAQVLVLFLALASTVHAHRVYIFAWVEGDTVHTESYFGSKKKVVGGIIKVFDPSGHILLEGKTDDRGEFSFKIPRKTDLRLVLEATMGHRAEYLLETDELPDIPERPTPSNNKGPQGPPSSPAQVDIDQIRILVEEALDSRLKPITKALARIQEERGPGFPEVIGGIGYVFGIMGLILYFRSRKKN